ncbi:MAG: D-alanyl-D-alanine carboxypeptidase [Eubacteriales bacterium]|nr:D-alanyl-D-alanine carboxypeptidase [Eubacteriales bacterium]MDD3882710.1 D-alanyl-D-alanine carboxypeptidase [Eubacteriales bacterium]MDD4512669.1 D-alanyl-D-alanine carboxypeptidase [Eubacteriales bacterium]
MKVKCLAGLLSLLFLLYNAKCVYAEEALPVIGSYASAVIIEETTGRVLYEQNMSARRPMASTTKVMTALVALENSSLDETVTASKNASGVPGTSIYLSIGESLTMREMLYGLMLASGNDAAVAIAEHIGGSVDGFAEMMNARAAELGLSNTCFLTPHGLPKDGHYTSAYDLAMIAREAMKSEVFREIVGTRRGRIPWHGREYERILINKNKLLAGYSGATGIKTGYTKAAGRCLVFSAEREGLSLIGVVLNCPDWFSDAQSLLDSVFLKTEMAEFISEGEEIRSVSVENGVSDSLSVIAGGRLAYPLLDGEDYPSVLIDLPPSFPAPIYQGQSVGMVSLEMNGRIVARVPIIAEESVAERTFRAALDGIIARWLAIGAYRIPCVNR